MSEMEIRRERSSQLINDASPYLNAEQTMAFANAITGAAMMNQMMAQMKSSEAPKIPMELIRVGAMSAGAAV